MATFTFSLANSNFDTDSTAFADATEADNKLTVNQGGFLISTVSDGAVLDGGDWTVAIDGAIGTFSNSCIGLNLAGGIGDSANIKIGATGYVFSSDTFGVAVNSARDFVLDNRGTISGHWRAIAMPFATTSVTITNSGLIEALGDDGIAVMFDENLGAHKLTNTGTVRGLGSTGAAIYAGDASGKDTIINRGLIDGYVFLGADDDSFTNFMKAGKKTFNGTTTGLLDLGAGADTFDGGGNAETVRDGGGADTYKLGGGNDMFMGVPLVPGGGGGDNVDGGTGVDTYSAAGETSSAGINLDKFARDTLAAGSAVGDTIGEDKLKNFENADGSDFSDIIFGSAAANKLFGGMEDDDIFGLDGNDHLIGGGGEDEIEGGFGDDLIEGGEDGDELAGYQNNDTIKGGLGSDFIDGGPGRDTLTGNEDDDYFWFAAAADSGKTSKTWDVITDFEGSGVAGGDQIILHFDANQKIVGEQFGFTVTPDRNGFGDFTDIAQIRFEYTSRGTLILGETNGDGKADFAILVLGIHRFSLIDADFAFGSL